MATSAPNIFASSYSSPRKAQRASVALGKGIADSPVRPQPFGVLSANNLASPRLVSQKLMAGYQQTHTDSLTGYKSIFKSKKRMTAEICLVAAKLSSVGREREALATESEALSAQLAQLRSAYKKALSKNKKALQKALESNDSLTTHNSELKAKIQALDTQLSSLSQVQWRSVQTTV